MNARAADLVYDTVSDLVASGEFDDETIGLEPHMVDEDISWGEFSLPPPLALGQAGLETPTGPAEAAAVSRSLSKTLGQHSTKSGKRG